MRTTTSRLPLAACIGATIILLPIVGGCDRDVSKSKVTTEKTTTTPDGVKKTTETTEKKVEVERKNP